MVTVYCVLEVKPQFADQLEYVVAHVTSANCGFMVDISCNDKRIANRILKLAVMPDRFTFLFEWEYNQYEAFCFRSLEDNGQTKYAVTFKPPNPFPQFGDQPHNLFTEPDGRFYCWGSSDKGCLYFRANLIHWLKKYLQEQERLSRNEGPDSISRDY